MNNDSSLIAGLRQAVRGSSTEFCKAYNDFSQDTIGETLRSVMTGQLRVAEKLSSLEKLFSSSRNENDKASSQEILEFKKSQGING